MYHNIGANYYHKGNYDKALDLFCRSLIVMSFCGLADHPDVDDFGKSLGACFEKSSKSDMDFTTWFRERVESYPSWCDRPYSEVAGDE
jgi:hypothetical protein